MFKKIFLYSSIFILSSFGVKDVLALDLGLTPSHVYGLWININKSLIGLANTRTIDQNKIDQLNRMSPNYFSDKTPGDVLKHAAIFRKNLDQLKKYRGLEPTTAILLEDNKKITPSVVFLNSGNILDSTVLLVIKNTAETIPISRFYHTNDISGKSPSDVYQLVDLANRRIDWIVANTTN